MIWGARQRELRRLYFHAVACRCCGASALCRAGDVVGHSQLAAQFASELSDVYGLQVTVLVIYSNSSLVATGVGGAGDRAPWRLGRRIGCDPCPLGEGAGQRSPSPPEGLGSPRCSGVQAPAGS